MQENQAIDALLRPVIESMGYELVGVVYHPNSVNALLRIFIDKEGGVVLDDCVAVNGQVAAILDVEDPIPSKYTLEISSPGLDRPLFTLADFEKFIGQMVKVRLHKSIDGQRNFKGQIKQVDGATITLTLEDRKSGELQMAAFDFLDVDTARLVPQN